MGTNPFLKNPFTRQSGINRRRSTRVEFEIPIILTGRDARGQSFRDQSQTKIVNLHGAKLKTNREILIGMQVGIENPQNGAIAKGVCIRIEETVPGENAHYIAVQLVSPGNIWGLTEPPADWAVVAANMGGVAVAAPPLAAPRLASGSVPDSAAPIIESQAVTWEQQSADLVESALQILRQQIQVLTSTTLKEFEKRLQVLEKEAGERFEQRAGKTVAEASTLIQAMQEDLATEIAAHSQRAVDGAESALRAKVTEIITPLVAVSDNPLLQKPVGTLSTK